MQFCRQINDIISVGILSITSVSYTHLDVYKRQANYYIYRSFMTPFF